MSLEVGFQARVTFSKEGFNLALQSRVSSQDFIDGLNQFEIESAVTVKKKTRFFLVVVFVL